MSDLLARGASPSSSRQELLSNDGLNPLCTMKVSTHRKTQRDSPVKNGNLNKVAPEDRAVHEWYRFVLSFPPHLVREYLARFQIDTTKAILDPFCGTGTTLVESKKAGVPSIGTEGTPMGYFATLVKTDWHIDPDSFVEHATSVASEAQAILQTDGIDDETLPLFSKGMKLSAILQKRLRTLSLEKANLLLENSISPLPLHKALVLLDRIQGGEPNEFRRHELLALAKTVVSTSSNLHFGPEVGVGKPKADAPVISPWLAEIGRMANDLRRVEHSRDVQAIVHNADARRISSVLAPSSVDAVFTSPPYPNEKDYTRTTRLESVLLGFLSSKEDVRRLKEKLVRSNTRSVYRDDNDDLWVKDFPRIQRIARQIEERRKALGKTSGFERLYPRLTTLYFGGMARHLAELRAVLRPGAFLGYVVGDQASYLRVMIRTGQLLAEIAGSLGYQVLGIDLFRTRFATATGEQLREEVVVLRWPG